jgi:hypothetical protein
MGLFDGYHDPDQFEASGGLLGRLISLQRLQGMPSDIEPGASSPALQSPIPAPMMPAPGTQWPTPNPQTPSAALRAVFGGYNPDPAPVGLQFGQAATMQPPGNGPSSGDADMASSAGRFQPVVSDASPDPIRPGSQYAQAPMALCAAGPAGCAAGGVLTAAQMMLGGAALGGLGALILHSHNQDNSSEDEKPASTPIGRRGEPIDVKLGTNRPATIGGRVFTGHATDRMQGRGVPPSAVEEAIQNGEARPGRGPGETVHIGANGVTVVTGSNGQVITVITSKQ